MTSYPGTPQARRSGPGAARWAIPLLLLAVLPACTGLPTDEEPRAGRPVVGAPLQDIEALPEGPSPGDSEQDIVRGFLQANQSFADGHEIARTYLADELASSWVPTDYVLVHTGEVEIETLADGEVDTSVEARGELTDDRRLTEFSSGTRRSGEFGLTQVQGQWRIDEFPEDFGLWLSETEFGSEFRTASIRYVSPVQDVFVPDVRWFPREEGLPTALARALLEPVPDELEGAVTTAVPQGTELIGGAVPVDQASGTATVNLSGPGTAEDTELASLLWAQFTSTLMQAGGVRQVDLQVNGQPVTLPDREGPLASTEELGYSTASPEIPVVLLRTGADLTAVDPDNYALRDVDPDDVAVPELPTVAEAWTDLATNIALSEFAAVSSDGTTLWRWRPDEEVRRSDIGTELTAPHFDSTGSLWLAGRSATGPRVWAISTGGELTAVADRVALDWLPRDTTISEIQVSPDAQRAVLVLRDELSGVQTLALTGIVRDREGDPVGLTEPRPVADRLVGVEDVTWDSTTSLLVVGVSDGDDSARPYRMAIDGWLQSLPAEPGAVGLRAVPRGEGSVPVLLTEDGGVFTQEGVGWTSYRNAADLIVPLG